MARVKKNLAVVDVNALAASYYTPELCNASVLLRAEYHHNKVLGFGNMFAFQLLKELESVYYSQFSRCIAVPLKKNVCSDSGVVNLMQYGSQKVLINDNPVSLYEEALAALCLKRDEPIDAYISAGSLLNAAYFTEFLLNNFICFVSDGKDRFLATTSEAIISAWGGMPKPDLSCLNLSGSNSVSSLKKGEIHVAKLTSFEVAYPETLPTFKVNKRKVVLNVNSAQLKVVPLFMVLRYWQLLKGTLSSLKKEEALFIAYSFADGKRRSISTALAADKISELVKGTALEKTGVSFVGKHLEFDLEKCTVRLPNFNSDCRDLPSLMEYVPLTDIDTMTVVPLVFDFKGYNFESLCNYFVKVVRGFGTDLEKLSVIYQLICSIRGVAPTSISDASAYVDEILKTHSFCLNTYGVSYQRSLCVLMSANPYLFPMFNRYNTQK